MKISKQKSLTSLIVFLFALSSMDIYIDGAKYLKYLIPPLCLIYALAARSKLQIKDPSVTAFSFLAIYTLALVPFGNRYGLHDFYFYLTFLAPFLVGLKPTTEPKNLLILFCILFFIIKAPILISKGFEYSIADSISSLEDHTLSFVIGLLAVFFMVSGRKALFAIALLVAILSLKRISLIAIALCGVGYFFAKNSKRATTTIVILALTANSLYVYFSYFVTTDAFNDLSISYFGVSAAHLTMGRSIFYTSIFDNLSSNIYSNLLGHGAGNSYVIAAIAVFSESGKLNLHNDILKIYYELGLIALLVFIFLLYGHKTKAIYLVLYINVIFLTDNISIYPLVIFVFITLCNYLYKENKNIDDYRTLTLGSHRDGSGT